MYRKTPSNPENPSPPWDGLRNRLRQGGGRIRRGMERYPFHFLAGMVICILLSGALAFTVMRVDVPTEKAAFPRPPAIGAGSAIGGIARTYGALEEIAGIQREIQAIIEKDSLGTADSIRLIDALHRFERLQRPTQEPKNSTP